MLRPLCLALGLASASLAQPLFEVQPLGVFPTLPSVDAEGIGVTANAGAGLAVISSAASCGLPMGAGLQYAHLTAKGDLGGSLQIPTGGPIPRPLASSIATELNIPIPGGAVGVSFTWEFFDSENSAVYNDAFEISVVDATGAPIGPPLVYVDCATLAGLAMPGNCASPVSLGGTEVGPIVSLNGVLGGPQSAVGFVLPLPLPTGAYLSVMCANDQDDALASFGVIDDVQFTGNLATWVFGQSGGPGTTFDIGLINCPPNSQFLMPVTFNVAGAFPNGWCLGVDIDIPTLLLELNFGQPFLATTDANGTYILILPPNILAPGTQLYASLGFFTPNLSFRFFPRTTTVQ